MPVGYQIIPEHVYPHQMTQINDNTEVTATYDATSSDTTALLCVFSSPKGRDNHVMTITGGAAGFVEEFGIGPFAQYGQPLLNAYAAAQSGAAVLHCMRVTATNASYSNTTLVAKYKVDGTEGAKVLKLKFFAKTSTAEITSIDDLDTACTVPAEVDEEGFTSVKLFTVASRGKGVYGKNYRYRITSDRTSDKNNTYKNYYLGVYTNENGLNQKEQFSVVFDSDALYSGASLFTDDVVNDSTTGSTNLKIATFMDGFNAIYAEYKKAQPDTTITQAEFDPFFGLNKFTREALPGLEIIPEATAAGGTAGEVAVSVSATDGVALTGGSDGDLAATVDATARDATLKTLYLDAFSGKTDPLIKSKNRFPTTFILDANYPIDSKLAIASLASTRGDCMAMLDCGTGIPTKANVKTYVDTNLNIATDRIVTIEPYCMKVRDPYSMKAVTVTSTYWLASAYPVHIKGWNGKHRPLAGNNFGIIDGYVKDSVYPVFDEDLDSEAMDELAEAHINFAKYNANQVIVRAMQDTRQTRQTNLSEQSNVLILLDIKRDCERLCATYEYDFSEVTDIARFNADIETVTEKYAAAQVRSISATFDKNAWEAERSILHLYVEMVNRDLIRTTIIEIDVNRS